MTTKICGLRDGQPWPAIGGIASVSNVEAVDLLNNKMAEPVKAVKPETATK